MKPIRILLAAAVLLAPGVQAYAADAADAVVEVPPAPQPLTTATPIHVWSGPYAGAFVGYNTSSFDQSGGADFDGEGFVGGVYAGYNLQNDMIVYGVEGDVGYSGLDADGFNADASSSVEADSNVFGSLRARVGVDADPFLVYGTAGVAAANKELSLDGATEEETHVGYTVGACVEAKITDTITSRLEYRYSDFGEENYDFKDTTVSSGFDEHSIRAGIALKF